MTGSPIALGPAAAIAHSSRDGRTPSVSSADSVDFAALLPAESAFDWRGEGSMAGIANHLDVETASPDPQMPADLALVPNAEQQFMLPVSYLQGPAVAFISFSGQAPALLPPSGLVEVQLEASGNRGPSTSEASDNVRAVSAGWNANAAGNLPAPFELSSGPTTFSDLIGDDVKVLSVASALFHRPANLGDRGESRGEGGVSIDVQTGESLVAQVPEKSDSVRVAPVAEVGQFASDQNAAPVGGRQTQPNRHTVGGVADVHFDVPLVDIDVSPTVGEMPRSAGIAQQLASAFQTLLDDSVAVTDTSQNVAAGSSVAYQSSLRVLDLVLQPQDLGRVSIKLRLSANGLSVTLEAEKNTTLQLLQLEASALSDRLISSGYDVESLSVQQLFSAAASPVKEVSASVSADHGRGSESAELTGQGNSGSASQGSNQQSRARGSMKQDAVAAVAEAAEPLDVRKHLYV